jgi:hypothetical protein
MKNKTASKPTNSKAIVRHVIALEKRIWKAAKERDAEVFRELVPDDAIMIFRSGIMRQPGYLATMSSRTVGHSKWKKLRGYMPSPTTVILTYETVRIGSFRGKKFPTDPVIESTTWIKRVKRWVAILNQETPVKA